jgi:hypothetical protein
LPRRLRPLFLLLLLVARPSLADDRVAVGAAEIAAGGGHDTNMFLQVSPDPAMREPLAVAGGGWRLEGSYDLDYRRAEGAGHLLHQELEVTLAVPPLGPLSPTLSLAAGRFDATAFNEDRFLFAAGELGLRLALGSAWRAAASYRAELRRYPDPARAETSLMHLGEARLAVETGGLTHVTFAPARGAVVADGTLRALRLGPELEVVRGRFTAVVGPWGGTLEVAGRSREWQVGAGLGALVRVSDNLDVAAAFDWTVAPWADPLVAAGYARRYFLLSLVGHATGRTSWRSEEDLRPLVTGGRVRFRMRAEAAAVEVIGSWDDWQTPGRPLERAGGKLWEGTIELPPGAHRYRFLVDGRAVKPPDAVRYSVDDFGGEDAVVDVAPAESR